MLPVLSKALLLGLLVLSWAGQVSAAAKQERIITIGGGVTEIVFALGKGRSVVATDTSSYFPKKASELPKVGYQRNLSVEGMLAFKPTMVLAAAEAGPTSVLKQLESSGVRIVTLNSTPTIKGLIDRINHIGDLLKEPGRAAVLANDMRASFNALKNQSKALGNRTPKVLFIMQHTGGAPMIAGANTNVHTLIELSGAENAAANLDGFRVVTPEAMIRMRPEVILTSRQTLDNLGGEQALWQIPGLSHTPAGERRNLLAMDALLLMGFSVRSPVAARQLLNSWQNLARQ